MQQDDASESEQPSAPRGNSKPASGRPAGTNKADSSEISPRADESKPAAQSEVYRVQLPEFDGPLDLLLHLVRKHELDILDIPIAFITEKYTAFVRMMEHLNIDIASEYLLMVATLIHIKSRMLLPNSPDEDADEGSEDSEDDPRGELVRRLLEYQKYKNVAEQLGDRRLLGNDVFPRGSTPEAAVGPAPLLQVSMFKLLDAFQGVLERTEKTQEHAIDFERISISDKIGQLSEMLSNAGKLAFRDLFSEDADRAEIIITFLALLEMTKLRMTRLFQDGPLEEIYVELTVSDDEPEEEQGASDEDPETSELEPGGSTAEGNDDE